MPASKLCVVPNGQAQQSSAKLHFRRQYSRARESFATMLASVMQIALVSMAVLQVSGWLLSSAGTARLSRRGVSCNSRLFLSDAAEINYGRDSNDLTPDTKVHCRKVRSFAVHHS